MNAPLFSVVIPVFNRAAWLRESLDSVFRQDPGNFEVIVVDDGSTDDTPEMLGRIDDSITVLRQENRGPSVARNLGLSRARGTYVAFLDSDDLWFPWTLSTYARVISECGSPAFIAGKSRLFADAREIRDTAAANAALSVERFQDYLRSSDSWGWFGVSSFVVRRDELQRVGGFVSERINSEDADLALRLGASPGFVSVKSPPTFGYRDHGGGAMANFDRTIAGVRHLVAEENAGRYPGGAARRRERIAILTRHLRPVAVECLNRGMRKEARELYRAAFRWHLRLGRWRFLAGFPLRAAMARP